MKTKTIYEEEILKEMQGLPEPMQEKLAKIVHFPKKEIIRPCKLPGAFRMFFSD